MEMPTLIIPDTLTYTRAFATRISQFRRLINIGADSGTLRGQLVELLDLLARNGCPPFDLGEFLSNLEDDVGKALESRPRGV